VKRERKTKMTCWIARGLFAAIGREAKRTGRTKTKVLDIALRQFFAIKPSCR